jgi:predicted cobalt transporter CbtA
MRRRARKRKSRPASATTTTKAGSLRMDGSELPFAALATVLTGIGFADLLFGVVFLAGKTLDAKSGLLWGLAAFTCVGLASAIGLPPQPPRVAVADLYARQIWWVGTVVATALGLLLLIGKAIGGPKLRMLIRLGARRRNLYGWGLSELSFLKTT